MVNASVVGMSARSTRRGTVNSLTNHSRRSSKKASEAFMHAYDIYCVNFYDAGLNAVRDAFVQQIKDGLRRSLFIIDLDKELEDAIVANSLMERSSVRKLSNFIPVDPTALTMMRINECLEEYELVSKKIDSEQNFDLMRYWQRFMPADLKFTVNKPSPKRPTSDRTPKNAKSNTDSNVNVKVKCFGVTSKDHHKVGKGKPLSKRLYIKDQPTSVRILILVIGKLTVDYYKSLLELMQPLRGIIHFLPEQCAYDLLVPRPRRDQQLRESIDKIQRDIHSLRKRVCTKPVGIFQQRIPQMSVCQATRHLSDIFNQLSWFMYDVHQLREQYEDYYLKPYKEINVQMPPEDKMQTTFDTARSLSIRGHYMNTQMPMVLDDIGTISLYMESLLNTFGEPHELLSELDVLLLANPSPSMQTRLLDKLLLYANAFKSIVKLPKSNHLVVDHSNPLLSNLVSYVDLTYLRNIYHACLEYNIHRNYFTSGYITNSLRYKPYTEDVDLRFLPKFAKLYLTDDSVAQRIIELIEEYETYEIEEIHPHIKLYTFEKALNEVVEHQKQINLPTRLCFRDFTLYEMEGFFKDLVTPEMLEKQKISDEKNTEVSKESSYLQVHNENEEPFTCNQPSKKYVVTPSIFILPKSLKAARLIEQSKTKEKLERQSARQSKEPSRATANHVSNESMNEYVKEEEVQGPLPGLPAGHRMLKGYNLDDTRQTIKVRTSKYHFDEGNITLYQEKWNFRQTNKCMSIDIDKQIIHLTNEIGNMNTTSPDVRIQTPSGISLRIKPQANECAKAVLSYPNGLTLYCMDTHAEHLWSDYENELNEKRRICTPYGAVIVFYRETDMVLIMRYNGEVYRLTEYVDVIVEPEAGEEDEPSSDFINACSTLSTYSSYKPLEVVKKKKSKRASGGAQRKGRTSSTSSESQAAREALFQAQQMKMIQDAALFASIDSELKFLEMLTDIFEFDYKQLKLTTALGSVVIVVKETQRIYCDKPVRVTEWHDYYANESYAMREDGVRMLWTHDSLKCYHADGTVITTGTIDGIDRGIIEDDIDREISTSSSHQHEEEEEKPSSLSSSDGSAPIVVNISDTGLVYSLENKVPQSEEKRVEKESIGKFIEEGEFEAELVYDYNFATYMPNSFTIMHKNYAGLNFLFSHINKTDLHLETKVFAADNINFWIRALPIELDLPDSTDSLDAEGSDEKIRFQPEPLSSEADPDEWTPPKRIPSYTKNSPEPSAVDIEGPQFSLELRGNQLTLHANLRKFSCDETAFPVCGNIKLVSKLDQDLSIVFRNWVESFHRFIDCSCPKKRITYFVESQGDACLRKGIELFKAVPTFGEYGYHAGNIHIDPVQVKKIQDQMVNNYEWYGKDMAKFPRFQERKREKSIETVSAADFPGLMSAKVFLQIPTQLAYTDRIHQFLDPFTGIKFRKMKHRFREALLFQLHPMLQKDVTMQMSKLSWKNRHAANKRRRFMEQQRLSLYAAMLRHKVYPNYFQFKDHYFGHVRNIDFFEFMSAKCNEKENPMEYRNQDGKEPPAKKTDLSSKEIKKLRKKCLCPKYINSL